MLEGLCRMPEDQPNIDSTFWGYFRVFTAHSPLNTALGMCLFYQILNGGGGGARVKGRRYL